MSGWLVFILLLYLNTEAAWLLYAVFNAVVAAAQVLSCVQLFGTPWTAGFPVLHRLPELAQTHVHQVSDAMQPSHPLSSPSSPAFNLA